MRPTQGIRDREEQMKRSASLKSTFALIIIFAIVRARYDYDMEETKQQNHWTSPSFAAMKRKEAVVLL